MYTYCLSLALSFGHHGYSGYQNIDSNAAKPLKDTDDQNTLLKNLKKYFFGNL